MVTFSPICQEIKTMKDDIKITKQNWKFYSNNVGNAPFLQYLNARGHSLEAIEAILEKSNTFNDLKKELTKWCKQERNFIEFANKNLPI